jgi:dienelactone hydrolase
MPILRLPLALLALLALVALVLLPLAACEGSSGAPPDAAADGAAPTDSGALPDTVAVADTATPPDTVAPPDTPAASDVAAPLDVPPSPDVAADVASDVGRPWPPLTPEFCGATPYEWLPPSAVGAPLEFRHLELIHTFRAAALDAILEQAGYGAVAPVPCGATIYRLRYTTQDRGVVREATAAVGVPDCAAAGEVVTTALWMHHSVGFVDACAPSRDPLMAAVAPALLASHGYVSVAPDLLGLMAFGAPSPEGYLHPYLTGEPTAIAGLDSVRAALRALAEQPALPQGDPRRLLVAGGSQGGHAAFFVDRYAGHYAPELHVLAVAAIVPPTDLGALVTHAVQEWGPAARVVPTFLGTLRSWYGVPADLQGLLTDGDPLHLATDIEAILAAACRFELRLAGADSLEDYFTEPFLATARAGDWAAIPPWDCVLRENSVATATVPRGGDAPVLAVFAEHDELIDTDTERADVARLCAQGYDIDVTVCAGLDHTEGGQSAMKPLLDWLAARAAGEPLDAEKVCVIPDPVECEPRAATEPAP